MTPLDSADCTDAFRHEGADAPGDDRARWRDGKDTMPTPPDDVSPARILVIDDNTAIHADIRKVLAPDGAVDPELSQMEAALFEETAADCAPPRYRIDAAVSGRDGVELVRRAVAEGDPYALAFVDMRMPNGWNGLETIAHLWQVDPHIQTVICTAYSDQSWTDIRRRLGDSDRLLILKKPFDNVEILQLAAALAAKHRLAQTVRRYTEELEQRVAQRTVELTRANENLQQEVLQRRAAEEKLQYDATHDALTGLANRSSLVEAIERVLARHRRDPQHQFAVLFIDLDDFKIVNDSLGHNVGDAYLRHIARRLDEVTNHLDAIAPCVEARAFRLGGDEFVILLEGIQSVEDAQLVARRLMQASGEPMPVQGHDLVANMSVGIAPSRAQYTDAGDVLRDADTALYHAKAQGKNRLAVFDQQMHVAIRQRLELEGELRAAVRDRQIAVHYQPVISLTTGKLHGFESLARWKHPRMGWVQPDQFIPIAEQSGQIVPMGEQLFEQVCADLACWRQRYPRYADLWVGINISPLQLCAPHLCEWIDHCLEKYGLEPGAVALEITENGVMENREAAQQALEKLRDRKLALALDDFGTGYSSLSHLQELPISLVKIDRRFVRHMSLGGRPYAATVHAIVELAHNRNLEVVAEGVETANQLFQLQSLECDYAQGYLFARPMPADQVLEHYLATDWHVCVEDDQIHLKSA